MSRLVRLRKLCNEFACAAVGFFCKAETRRGLPISGGYKTLDFFSDATRVPGQLGQQVVPIRIVGRARSEFLTCFGQRFESAGQQCGLRLIGCKRGQIERIVIVGQPWRICDAGALRGVASLCAG